MSLLIPMLSSMKELNGWAAAPGASAMPCAGWVSHEKKSFVHPRADDDARSEFVQRIKQHDSAGRPLVYIDESGFAVDMPRTHGWSAKGKRCYGRHDWQARGRVNVIGALHNNRLINVCLFDTTINGDVFHAWLTEELSGNLPSEAVIVMDNASFHKRADTEEGLRRAGHIIEYLPAYSPDLNPIEQKWAQAKALRRKCGCDVDTLFSGELL